MTGAAAQPALNQQQQMLLQQGILLGQQMAAQQLQQQQQQQQQQMQQQLQQQMQQSFAAQPQWGHAAAVAPAPPQPRPVAPQFAFGATAQPTYAGFSSAVPEEEAYDYYAQAYSLPQDGAQEMFAAGAQQWGAPARGSRTILMASGGGHAPRSAGLQGHLSMWRRTKRWELAR